MSGRPARRTIVVAVRVSAAVVLLAGVVCQVVQRTDPTFPFAYFTVDSALLLAGVLVCALLRPRSVVLDHLRGAATTAVVLSGLVFATVIAPSTETGTWFQPHDDPWVRAANVLLHGAGPLLAVTDLLANPLTRSRGTWATAARWCWWPAAWAAVMVPLDIAGLGQVPYPFLQVDTVGPAGVAGAMLVLLPVVVVLGAGLLALHDASARLRPSADALARSAVRS